MMAEVAKEEATGVARVVAKVVVWAAEVCRAEALKALEEMARVQREKVAEEETVVG